MSGSAPAPKDGAAFGHRLRGEQIEALFKAVPPSIMGAALGGLILLAMMWESENSRAALWTWYALLLLANVARGGISWFYWRDPRRKQRAMRWGSRQTIASGLVGVAWGSAFYVFSLSPAEMATSVLLLAGVIGAAVATLGAFFPTYAVYALACALPLLFRALGGGDLYFTSYALAIFVFIGLCLGAAWRNQSVLLESIRLRFENLDLVEAMRVEKELAEAARLASERANQAKSKFLASASHDLRQPMQALLLFVDALEAQRKGRAQHEGTDGGLVANIREASQSLADMLNDLLDLSRVEAGTVRPRMEPVRLQALFDRLDAEFSRVAALRGLRFGVVPTRFAVLSDPLMLERILRNLLANALRYTPAGGVMLCARRSGGMVRIEVRDSGIGIAEEEQQAIFSEFYQVDNPERDREKGLGLGLAIVDGLARALGHHLTLRSRPGRGSVFGIVLPAAASVQPVEPSAALEQCFEGRRVAVIDDDALVRAALAETLRSLGCIPVTGESAAQCIELLDGECPDAVFADYRLRGGRLGTQAIAELRGHCRRDVPAAILTGDTEPARLREISAAGLPILHKPVQANRLHAMLSSLLLARATPTCSINISTGLPVE